jgi:hypothetical protein
MRHRSLSLFFSLIVAASTAIAAAQPGIGGGGGLGAGGAGIGGGGGLGARGAGGAGLGAGGGGFGGAGLQPGGGFGTGARGVGGAGDMGAGARIGGGVGGQGGIGARSPGATIGGGAGGTGGLGTGGTSVRGDTGRLDSPGIGRGVGGGRYDSPGIGGGVGGGRYDSPGIGGGVGGGRFDAPGDRAREARDFAQDRRDFAGDRARDTRDFARDQFQDTRDQLRDTRDQLRDTRDMARGDLRDTRDFARDQVQDRRTDLRDRREAFQDRFQDRRADFQDRLDTGREQFLDPARADLRADTQIDGRFDPGIDQARYDARYAGDARVGTFTQWDQLATNWTRFGVPTWHQNWYGGPWQTVAAPFWGGYGMSGFSPVVNRWGGAVDPWMLNSMAYRWGYFPYTNPYLAAGTFRTPVAYSQPISVAYAVEQRRVTPEVRDLFAQARESFRFQEYDRALRLVDQVIRENPSDPVAHEFRALTLFAQGRYDESAATLNALLAVAPGWDWQTMRSLYPNVETYTEQLRTLEDYAAARRRDAAPRFVLAYHYLVAGHDDAAAQQLDWVTRLEPDDLVAQRLLAALQVDEQHYVAMESRQRPVRVDERELIGTWVARGPADGNYQLLLQDNGQFRWVVDDGRDRTVLTGDFVVEEGTLLLEGDRGALLAGHLVAADGDRFRFRLLGAPPDDRGLTFQRR